MIPQHQIGEIGFPHLLEHRINEVLADGKLRIVKRDMPLGKGQLSA